MNKLEARAVSSGKIRHHVTQGYLLSGLSWAVRFRGALIFNYQSSSAAQYVAFHLPGSYEQMEPAHLQISKDRRDGPSANFTNFVQERAFSRFGFLFDDGSDPL